VNERTKKLEAVFHSVMDLASAEERERCLNEVCASDPELRREVDALLKSAEAADAVFQAGREACRVAEASLAVVLTEKPGDRIGRYKLLEQIGEGGMGIVYVAEQEEPVRRRVALKIIKLGMDTRQVVARFEAERQALALMDHPHIAKVLDAGATDSGRPYFVMELVQGVPITQFCDENRLSPVERIKLFIPVCQAIQSAHQKGVIHRDLKPSNVLVTLNAGMPHPLVIDFGVAKATNQKLTEKTFFTNFATMIGTPAYMSPEQAEMSKLDVDTRSDIYSLGVLLYELLTGTTPFPEERLRSVAYGEMQRIIAEEEPERPSTRLSRKTLTGSAAQPATRHSSLATDLDWIVMKCLEKDRNRRYETANGLAADIQKHLDNEPVVARPPSAAYRFQKLLRRNRAASVGFGLVTLAVAIGAVVSAWALFRERAARRQSEERLRAALIFVDDVFNKVAPEFIDLAGASDAQEKLGLAGLTFLQRLRGSTGDDPVLRLALARVFVKMSQAQNPGNANTIGDYQAGLQWAQQANQLLTNGSLPVSEGEQLQLLWWVRFSTVQCLYGLGRVDEGIGYLYELDVRLQELEHDPDFARRARRFRQTIRNNAGYNTTLAGRPAEAIQRFLLPVLNSDWARSIATNSEGYELETLMNANANVASAHLFLKQFQAMRRYADESVQLADVVVRRFPSNARYSRGRVHCLAHQGYALIRTGETDRGMAALNTSREAIEGLVRRDEANDQFRQHRAVTATLQAMGFAAWSEETSASMSERRRRLAQAETYLAEADEFSRATKAKEPELYLKAARAEVAGAEARLETGDETR
jgi:hypothetical protein